MTDPNAFEIDSWERELGHARAARLGPAAGSVELGCSVIELDPGGQSAPYHLHYAQEELLIVLEGELELRTPSGTRPLSRGVIVGFPAGPDGAHRVRNTSNAKARYVMVSTMRYPELAEYPDTGTVLAVRGPGDGRAFPHGSAGDWGDLVHRALEADSPQDVQ
jgi:uncharacterized cupin superfamily protein